MGQLTPGQERQVDYWASFGEFLDEHDAPFKPPKPYPSNWVGYGVGRTGTGLIVVLNQDEAIVKIDVDSRANPTWFPLLLKDRSEIESALGLSLEWEEKPGNKHSSIQIRHAFDATLSENWPAIHKWHLDTMTAFRNVFRPRIKALDASEWQQEEEDQ